MRDAFAAELLRLASDDDRVMFLTGDLGFGVFEEFIEACPRQYLNVGVAEQNLIAVATGLALEGRIVFAYSIGNFPVLRCLEQIRNDAAYHRANVTVVSIGGGFSYGPLGMSHHATEDLAIMRAIPEVVTAVPGTTLEVRASMRALVAQDGAGYLRLDKSSGYEPDHGIPFEFGDWRIFAEGADVTLVAVGGVLGEAQRAARMLRDEGTSARVVSAHTLSPLANRTVTSAIGASPVVVTLEEHVIRGGLGGLVAEVIAEEQLGVRLVRLGLDGPFVSEVGSQAYLRERVGLNASSVVQTVRGLLD